MTDDAMSVSDHGEDEDTFSAGRDVASSSARTSSITRTPMPPAASMPTRNPTMVSAMVRPVTTPEGTPLPRSCVTHGLVGSTDVSQRPRNGHVHRSG